MVAELPDGAVIVERAYKGIAFLVREVLKEAGDAAVLEPAEARDAVLAAAEAPARSQPVNRRHAIRMTDAEALAFLDEQRTVVVRHQRPRRLART